MTAEQARHRTAAALQAEEAGDEAEYLHRHLIEGVEDDSRRGESEFTASFDGDHAREESRAVAVQRLRDDGFNVTPRTGGGRWLVDIDWRDRAEEKFEAEVAAAMESDAVRERVEASRQWFDKNAGDTAAPNAGTEAEVEAFRRALAHAGFKVYPADGEDGPYTVITNGSTQHAGAPNE